MNEETLKNLWKSHNVVNESNKELLRYTKASLNSFEQEIQRRNRIEMGVALFLIPVCTMVAIFIPPLVSRIGMFLIIPSCLFVIYYLRKIKKQQPVDPSQPLITFLEEYRTYMIKEKRLLDTAMYWYVLPVLIPVVLFFVGLEKPVLAFAAILCAPAIHYLNRKTAKEYIQPLINKMDETIRSLQD